MADGFALNYWEALTQLEQVITMFYLAVDCWKAEKFMNFLFSILIFQDSTAEWLSDEERNREAPSKGWTFHSHLAREASTAALKG